MSSGLEAIAPSDAASTTTVSQPAHLFPPGCYIDRLSDRRLPMWEDDDMMMKFTPQKTPQLILLNLINLLIEVSSCRDDVAIAIEPRSSHLSNRFV